MAVDAEYGSRAVLSEMLAASVRPWSFSFASAITEVGDACATSLEVLYLSMSCFVDKMFKLK